MSQKGADYHVAPENGRKWNGRMVHCFHVTEKTPAQNTLAREDPFLFTVLESSLHRRKRMSRGSLKEDH